MANNGKSVDEGWFKVPNSLLPAIRRLSATDLKVLLVLLRFQSMESGIARPSYTTISRNLGGIQPNHVSAALSRLESLGFIRTIERRRGKPTIREVYTPTPTSGVPQVSGRDPPQNLGRPPTPESGAQPTPTSGAQIRPCEQDKENKTSSSTRADDDAEGVVLLSELKTIGVKGVMLKRLAKNPAFDRWKLRLAMIDVLAVDENHEVENPPAYFVTRVADYLEPDGQAFPQRWEELRDYGLISVVDEKNWNYVPIDSEPWHRNGNG